MCHKLNKLLTDRQMRCAFGVLEMIEAESQLAARFRWYRGETTILVRRHEGPSGHHAVLPRINIRVLLGLGGALFPVG